jgi:DNA-binding NtrC family response regulator
MSRFDLAAVPLREVAADDPAPSATLREKQLVFGDRSARELLALMERVAPSGAPVLIVGESGTGKELIARHIHRRSGRRGDFLAVNCGAIAESLAESELFGHESGAFTGAQTRRFGWFEAAHRGTLFLDEVGDLPPALQGKLLRVLQEGEVTRVGSRKPTPVDVRVIAATNVDLDAAVAAGKFRLDLLYRLNIVPVHLPPLRARPGDIGALTAHFIGFYAAKLGREPPRLGAAALHVLQRHAWPGNIRELENVIHYALLVATGETIEPAHLRIRTASHAGAGGAFTAPNAQRQGLSRIGAAFQECFAAPGGSLLRDVERRLVEDAYRHCESNQVRTAELLGISRNVVRTLLKRHGLLSDADVLLAEGAGGDESAQAGGQAVRSASRVPAFDECHEWH